MMTNPAYYLPQAVYSSAQTSEEVQETTAKLLIGFVGSFLPLQMSWSAKLSADQSKYFDDMMTSSPSDPSSVAKTAADYAEYQQDSAEMSRDTGALSNVIHSQEAAVSLETQHLGQEYGWISSLSQYTQVYCMLLRLKQ
ncbi:MAG TPA: hypothetical protein VLE96_05725 [Chlamydiales bacterium]|nr:hypothetical protein [Chlamydiales bacterium]